MKTIDIKIVNDGIFPVSDFPNDTIKIVFDGTNYTVYEQGDDLPPEPIYNEQL